MKELKRKSLGCHYFLIVYSCIVTLFSQYMTTAAYTLSLNQSLVDGQTLISQGGTFELGFFSPANSKNRYLGIWYKRIRSPTVVWVANRDAPLNDASGVLKIGTTGNIVVVNQTGCVIWSSNTSKAVELPIVEFLDSGNLVLRDVKNGDSKSYLWQSFDYPSNMLLPDSKAYSRTKTWVIIIVGITVLVGMIVLGLGSWCTWKKRSLKDDFETGICTANWWNSARSHSDIGCFGWRNEIDMKARSYQDSVSVCGSSMIYPRSQESDSTLRSVGYNFSSTTELNQALLASIPALPPTKFLRSTFKDNRNCSNLTAKSNEEVRDSSSVMKKSSELTTFERPKIETPSPLPSSKVSYVKLGDRITALQELVSPFGKTDTASVLLEAIGYIKFLHEQVGVLSTPYMNNGAFKQYKQITQNSDKSKDIETNEQDLKSRGICLVPISSISQLLMRPQQIFGHQHLEDLIGKDYEAEQAK